MDRETAAIVSAVRGVPSHLSWPRSIAATLTIVCAALVAGLAPTPAAALTLPTGCSEPAFHVFDDANFTLAIQGTECWLAAITTGEMDIPRDVAGQVTACHAAEAHPEAWPGIEQLDGVDFATAETIRVVNDKLYDFATYFGDYFDDSTTSTPPPGFGRIDAFDDEKILIHVLQANGRAAYKLKELPNHLGFSSGQGVAYDLGVLGGELSRHDCAQASKVADETANHYSAAKAAAMTFPAAASPNQ